MDPRQRLDPDAAAEVLARAAAIEAAAGQAAPDGLDDDAVVAIGREVGLPEAAVRRALAEHQAGTALALPATHQGRPQVLLGRGTLSRARIAPAPLDEVRNRLERLLSQAVLRPVRNTRSGSIWAPRTGVLAGLRRRVDPPGPLRWLTRLHVQLVALGPGTTQVILVAACQRRWRGHRTAAAGSLLLGAAGLGAAVAGAVADPTLLLATPAVGVGAIGVVAARGSWLRLADEVELSLDGLLDAAEQPAPVDGAPQIQVPAWLQQLGRRTRHLRPSGGPIGRSERSR